MKTLIKVQKVTKSFVAILLTLLLAVSSHSSANGRDKNNSNSKLVYTQSAVQSLILLPLQDGSCVDPCATGTVELMRRSNGTLLWAINASGMIKGHTYTVWLVNSTDPFDIGVAHAGGGVVGGNGSIMAAGNQCVSAPDDASEIFAGFVPGSGKDCDYIDIQGLISIVLVDHGEWTPGDMLPRWTPFGGFASYSFATFVAF